MLQIDIEIYYTIVICHHSPIVFHLWCHLNGTFLCNNYYEWFKLYYYTNDKVHSDIMGNEPYRAIIRSLRDLHYCSDLYFNQIANRTHFICCVVTIYIWYTYYIQHIKLKLKLKLLSSNVFLNNNLVRLSSNIHYMPTFFPTCSCFD